MKKSVMSAAGSSEISGASRWLAAFAVSGPGPRTRVATRPSAAAVSARPPSRSLLLIVSPLDWGSDALYSPPLAKRFDRPSGPSTGPEVGVTVHPLRAHRDALGSAP